MKLKLFQLSILIWMILNCFSCYHHKRISSKKLKELNNPIKITIRNIDGKIISNVRVQLEDRETKETKDAYFHRPTKAFYFSKVGSEYLKITGTKYRPQRLDISNYSYGLIENYQVAMVKKGEPYYLQYDQKAPYVSFPKYIATLSKTMVYDEDVSKFIDSLGLVIVNDEYFYVEMLYNTLSWQPIIYKKKDDSDFHPYQDPILEELRRSELFQYVGASVGKNGICDSHFSIRYLPKYSWDEVKALLEKYDLEVIQHVVEGNYVYLKAGDGIHEGIMEIWRELFENEMISFIYPNFHFPMVFPR